MGVGFGMVGIFGMGAGFGMGVGFGMVGIFGMGVGFGMLYFGMGSTFGIFGMLSFGMVGIFGRFIFGSLNFGILNQSQSQKELDCFWSAPMSLGVPPPVAVDACSEHPAYASVG